VISFFLSDTGTLAFEGVKIVMHLFSVFDFAGEGAGGKLTTVEMISRWWRLMAA
jgi:hypothetical protein